jgi:hypothetical protein
MLEDEFAKARKRCIEYQGRGVYLYEELTVPPQGSVRIRIEGTRSEWRQGLWIGQMIRNSRLRLKIDDVTAPSRVFWTDTCPSEVEMEIEAPDGILHLSNIWESGRGQRQSQQEGAGMLREEVRPGVIRYRCNDGHAEATFDHLVFTLELASGR